MQDKRYAAIDVRFQRIRHIHNVQTYHWVQLDDIANVYVNNLPGVFICLCLSPGENLFSVRTWKICLPQSWGSAD